MSQDYHRGYKDGYEDGYRKGMEDFELRHAMIMAQMEKLIKYCSEVEINKPRIIIMEKPNEEKQ